MPERNQAALDFLLTRRSRPAKTLAAPGPSRAELEVILTAAARTPDHGKLEPWRFVVLEGAAFSRLADLVRTRGAALEKSEADIAKSVKQFDDAVVCLAVVSSPKPSPKVPQIEQVYSAGAVCLAALNAGLASGWGASWLTGWHCFDRGFVEEGLGLSPEESIAGLIFYGTEQVTPPERPRPELKEITTWISD
ncbi:Putative NAD(P)H nitroreductase YdjA [Pseudooceanicola marinus]|uniref:Putative NAD(P)H nitroreductase n=1 Tax=Pseudooceanicola marinus TaxID=396013 RepID=A0A1X6Z8C5_9RHOB|nr:nitroreductase [Pseudooceanicola marinus]PJE32186.1 nitroreductase [Pseudooceanicola marinus]SLN41831.1 Putative NAD(P)H nitroreductase YdjA [Pseudooceanicola marinus]